MFPSHPVWNHPVFRHEAYAPFAREVEICMQEGEGPSQLSILYQAMPLVVDYLKAMKGEINQKIGEVKESVNRVADLQQAQSSQIQFLTSGGLTFRLDAPPAAPWPRGQPAHPRLLMGVESRPGLALTPAPPPLSVAGSSRYTSAQASVTNSPSSIASPASPLPPPTSQVEPDPELDLEREQPPTYRMCRAVKTVKALWREWTVGLGGNPSVSALDAKWGNRWRAGRQSELQWYSLRLEVIKEIRRVAQAQRISEEAAMWQVNSLQENMNCSLDQFCKRLRAGRKAHG
jgi:hypothetical protein